MVGMIETIAHLISLLGGVYLVISTVQGHKKLSANALIKYCYLLLNQITNVKNLRNSGAIDQCELPLILFTKKSPSYLVQGDH